jgi:hypothetical protein
MHETAVVETAAGYLNNTWRLEHGEKELQMQWGDL